MPRMTEPLHTESAATLAAVHWSVHGTAHPLPSYLDRNYLIDGPQGRHVLKIAHPSWAQSDLDLENRAMLALAEHEPDIGWPRVRFTTSGEHLLSLPIDGERHFVRLLSFVPGGTWADQVPRLAMPDRAVLEKSLGAVTARLTLGLADFRHPAAARKHPWNLLALPGLADTVPSIPDSGIRAAVATHMARVSERMPQWREQLPMAVAHNDVNDHNVIVRRDAAGVWQVGSVIDFGDMCTSFRIANLVTACTYAMAGADDPAACARRIVGSYLAHATLSDAEREALCDLIRARICQSILMAARAHAAQPDNDYILVSQQALTRLLPILAALAPTALCPPAAESAHD